MSLAKDLKQTVCRNPAATPGKSSGVTVLIQTDSLMAGSFIDDVMVFSTEDMAIEFEKSKGLSSFDRRPNILIRTSIEDVRREIALAKLTAEEKRLLGLEKR